LKRALVSLPDGIWEIIENDLKGKMGEGNSDIIRSIIIAYLSEKGYMDKGGKSVKEKQD
jgi:metal-responsive CopG/Arc/MetJ family transcriptional regulator